jgi:hypothetical protein
MIVSQADGNKEGDTDKFIYQLIFSSCGAAVQRWVWLPHS